MLTHSPLEKSAPETVIIVLAMHGIPPNDFPKEGRKTLFELRAALRYAEDPPPEMIRRHEVLDAKMRQWPRTQENDPFYSGSLELGKYLSEKSGFRVIVGFNEFCDPDLEKAIRRAVQLTRDKVIVTTPMMTRGGGHSKGDIPAAIKGVQQEYPNTEIIYAWPFAVPDVAGFLAEQIRSFIK